MITRSNCPKCGSNNYKKNGHTHNGKQNHLCKDCGREFVLNLKKVAIPDEKKELAEKLLLERISLRGICRALNVSLTWLLGFMVDIFESLPEDLNFQQIGKKQDIILMKFEAEIDEMWSFVGKKNNKQWIWIALDSETRQVIAFYLGDRSKESARKLWNLIPEIYRKNSIFYTDQYESYTGVIPENQHIHVSKDARKTNHIERFNCTLRQRVSRLVRKALSFSKKLENHIGAIKYFICHYNKMKAQAKCA
jgi:IS1 family transposase